MCNNTARLKKIKVDNKSNLKDFIGRNLTQCCVGSLYHIPFGSPKIKIRLF